MHLIEQREFREKSELIAAAMFEGYQQQSLLDLVFDHKPKTSLQKQPPHAQRYWMDKAERFLRLWG